MVLAETVHEKLIREYREQQARSHFASHRWTSLKMDCCGTLINLLLFPGSVFVFLFLLGQRLDEANDISYFILLIPVWVCALPVFAYVILNGIAAQNTKINKCEKLALSVVVPFGFLLTLVLLICYVEGLLTRDAQLPILRQAGQAGNGEVTGVPGDTLIMVFLPHFVSLLCLYLYLRCLVRPVRVQDSQNHVTQESQRAKGLSQPSKM